MSNKEQQSQSSTSAHSETVWRCLHCKKTIPGMAPGFVPLYCMMCGEKTAAESEVNPHNPTASQTTQCVNPDCNEPLFTDGAEMCHKCHTSQKGPTQSDEKASDLRSHSPTLTKCDNPECTTNLSSEHIKFCKKCAADSVKAKESATSVKNPTVESHKDAESSPTSKAKSTADDTAPLKCESFSASQPGTSEIQTGKNDKSQAEAENPTANSESVNSSTSSGESTKSTEKQDNCAPGGQSSEQLKQSSEKSDVSGNTQLSRKTLEESRKSERNSSLDNSATGSETKRRAVEPEQPVPPVSTKTAGAVPVGVEKYQKTEHSKQGVLFSGTKKESSVDPTEKDTSKSCTEARYDTRSRGSFADISGIKSSPTESTIAVTFHAMVPKNVWYWKKDTCVVMRFGDQRLGQWKQDIAILENISVVEDDLVKVQCTLNIETDLLTNEKPIAYKYLVRPRHLGETFDAKGEHYESLQGAPTSSAKFVNRCLVIPRDKLKRKGSFEKFDTMVLPEQSIWKAYFVGKLKSAWATLSRSNDKVLINRDAMQAKCLKEYLKRQKSQLCNRELSPEFNIPKCIDQIKSIYLQLYRQLIYNRDSDSWRCHSLKEVIKEWFVSIVHELQTVSVQNPEENGRKMSSVLVVLGSIHSLSINDCGVCDTTFHLDFYVACFLMISLQPDVKLKKCTDLDIIMSLLPDNNSKTLISVALRVYCKYLFERRNLRQPQWLKVIPLIHILQNKSIRFGSPKTHKADILWNGDNWDLGSVKGDTRDKHNLCLMDKWFDGLEPLTILDPLLLPIIVSVCPRSELPQMILRIPPYLSIAWIATGYLDEFKTLNKDEVKDVTELIQGCLNILKDSDAITFAELKSVADNTQILLDRIIEKLNNHMSAKPVEVIISLLLHSVDLLIHTCDVGTNMMEVVQKQQGHIQHFVFEKVENWINKLCGIEPFKSAKEEIKLFDSLLHIDCPKELEDKWKTNIVRTILTVRIRKVDSFKNRVDLFCMLGSQVDAHPTITDALMEGILQCRDSTSSRGDAISRLYADSSQRDKVGEILNNFMKKQYPNEEKELTFDDLLKWELWPTYLTAFKTGESQRQYESCLNDHTTLLCTVANSLIETFYGDIEIGKITIQEIEKVSSKSVKEQVKKLCLSACPLSDVEQLIQLRSNEGNYFTRYKNNLGSICQRVSIPIEGLKELRYELQRNYDTCNIASLCTSDGSNKYTCHHFRAAAPLLSISVQFNFMANVHINDLFLKLWGSAEKNASNSKPKLVLQDIVDLIWTPAFNKCCTILESIRDRSITLQTVDDLFGHNKDPKKIENDLREVYYGVQRCKDETVPLECPPWIITSIKLMQEYWTLARYASAAKTVLNLRHRLGLSGNFSHMETIASQISSSMKTQPLDSIDDSLIEAGDFLKTIERDETKLRCISVFAECFDFVEWIRQEYKRPDDLRNFVSIALHTTAGETDYGSDCLSNLKMVGSGFEPLIFGLKRRSIKSFEEFREKCTAIWESLKTSPDLPDKLLDCKDQLIWYKQVKASQGTIEETTFDQMTSILQHGIFTVGTEEPNIYHSIHDVISLTLCHDDKRLIKHYNLNDLRDLESKLALIVGKNAQNKTEVGNFTRTLCNICRIAEVLISLQQAGHVRFIGWTLQISCHDHFSVIQEQAKVMERKLEEWARKVHQKRGEFYELNYYTTLQLLTLCQELGKIKSNPHSDSAVITPGVLALLESISYQLSVHDIHTTVQSVTSGIVHSSVDRLSPSNSGFIHQGIRDSLSNKSASSPHTELSRLSEEIMESVSIQASQELRKTSRVDSNDNIPKLTEEDLTQDQKAILLDLINRLDYPTPLVLTAFEECTGTSTKYDILNWCENNFDNYEFNEEVTCADGHETDFDESVEYDDSDDELSEFVRPSITIDLSPNFESSYLKSEQITGSDSAIMQIEFEEQEPIDQHNPVVKRFVSAGFSLEDSLFAVKRYGTQEQAMNYLMSLDDEDLNMSSSECSSMLRSKSLWRQTSTGSNPAEQPRTLYPSKSPVIHYRPNIDKKYLTLDELGRVLTCLSKTLKAAVPAERSFNSRIFKCGQPNLIVTPLEHVLRTVLALYMDDEALPLPTFDEVLICNANTTAEEVTLLWQKAIGDPKFRRVFCLAHAEKLSYQVSEKALRSLSELTQEKKDYRIVIICSSVDEEKTIISKLHNYRRPFAQIQDIERCQHYLKSHFTGQVDVLKSCGQPLMASVVGCENSCVRLVTSHRSGMGKSLYIQRMSEELEKHVGGNVHNLIPLHGPRVTSDIVLDFLQNYMSDNDGAIFHLDVAPSILSQVDTILFSLLILRGLADSQGRVWRCHPGQLYAIELTLPNRNEQSVSLSCTLALTVLLPTVHCVSPLESLKMLEEERHDDTVVVMDEHIFSQSTCQRVYQYLQRHSQNDNLDSFTYSGRTEGDIQDCLSIFFRYCGIRDPSWSDIRNFIKFLDVQLQSCEGSVFCQQIFIHDVMSGLKSFVVKFMIRMSRDFATSSLQGEVARDNLEPNARRGTLEQYQINARRLWEQSSHPYIFFNLDRESLTPIGFKVTRKGDLIDPTCNTVLEKGIMSAKLHTGLRANKVNLDEDYRLLKKHDMILWIARVMGIDFLRDPDETYVLTVDNLIKILAIQMRFRCGIPVVIMGETGCGKTRLIRYMCDLARQGEDRNNMLILKVHGGTTEYDIENFIRKAEVEAVKNQESKMDTVVFFDEANTTDAIGLIKEIMCDRRIHGRPISGDLKFIAACNPYRKHHEDMIKKLESAGLGFYVRDKVTHQTLGNIPLRQLVYRVLDLPPSMRPLVYDFGQLQQRTEDDYIKQIVHDNLINDADLQNALQPAIPAISRILSWSQAFMRNCKNECSFVSLRDVERAMIVFKYFYNNMNTMFSPLINQMKKAENSHLNPDRLNEGTFHRNVDALTMRIDDITSALILSLSVCYHARLENRTKFESEVARLFVDPLILPGGVKRFQNEIRWCQEGLLNNMKLGENIAKNAALRENVFMMAICIELRIPLFLVGKPGSSKSLAKSVIHASMRGKSSNNELLTGFKEVDMFSYQCSQLSTPESVIEVFNTAKRFQSKQDVNNSVAVVVLDEVGLAEDSPNLPLKALHPLLEDGTQGAGAKGKETIVAREERVAFIGISNWALDPAKMNRGIMVTRGIPSTEELEMSAESICSNKEDDPVRSRLKPYFQPLSAAYMEIMRLCKEQNREFFGLRDFYSLIKMLYWMCKKSDSSPTWPQFQHVIMRNFGGLEELDPLKIFDTFLAFVKDTPVLDNVPEELHSIVNPDCTRLGLIRASLSSKERTWHGENRYLLFLTENFAALSILKYYLSGVDASFSSTAHVTQETMEPFILFGSTFPKDREYTQICRNINQIKICMETGRTVILLNLENLYESLYDVLNQYYICTGVNRYVDLGLQTHRVRCRVHDDFKLILIANKDTVYKTFPIPLINRLEKHFVLTSSVLEDRQIDLLREFDVWISNFCEIKVKKFARCEAFIGYQSDTPAAVIFQATNFLRRLKEEEDKDVLESRLNVLKRAGIYENNDPGSTMDGILEETQNRKTAVLLLSQYLLLQTAAPEAVIRLKNSDLSSAESSRIKEIYFKHQQHQSIKDFLVDQFQRCKDKGGLLMQVTTHSHLLAYDELDHIQKAIGKPVKSCFLHEFETELDFTSKISPFFKRYAQDKNGALVVIQCDSGQSNGDLIACARNRVYDIRSERENDTHVVFVVNLLRQRKISTFVGFQGDPWISVHIDALTPTSEKTILLCQAAEATISNIFLGDDEHRPLVQTMKKPNSQHCSDVESDSEMDTSPFISTPVRRNSMDSVSESSLIIEDIEEGELMSESSSVADKAMEVELESKIPPQYQRLYGCIQAAVSRVKDNNNLRPIQRVEILVNLIPSKASVSRLDENSFHGILVHHVFEVLKERDCLWTSDKEWVLNEAMDTSKLQKGGTFRNALARKLDDVLVLVFSEIISCIDQNYNLDLLSSNDINEPLHQFWLNIFRRHKLMQFSFKEMTTPKERVPGVDERRSVKYFKCQLPFSWIIKAAFDAQWDNAKSLAGNDRQALHKQLCEAIDHVEVGEVLSCAQDNCTEAFYGYYVHDFVRSVHMCQHRKQQQEEMEYSLIRSALDALVRDKDFCSIDGHNILKMRIAALHVVYKLNQSQIMWFSQLVSHRPGIMLSLQNQLPSDTSEMVLHQFAVKKAIEDLTPPLERNELAEHLLPWLNDIHLSQNAINTILNLPPCNSMLEEARLKWQLIRALQLFLEHVLIKHKSVPVAHARRLEMHLESRPDFLQASTLTKLRVHLTRIDKQLRSKYSPKIVANIQRDCCKFFMEVVSRLCFGGNKPPEPDLIKMLMDTIFTEKRQTSVDHPLLDTRVMTPYQLGSDEIPVVRSFLLQLLLDYNTDQVKEYLNDYFKKSHQAFGKQIDRDLCLLCIQCFEDAIFKQEDKEIFDTTVERAAILMKEGHTELCHHVTSSHITLEYLLGVAKVRFAMSIVAIVLNHSDKEGVASLRLLHRTKEICTDSTVNVVDTTGHRDTVGPGIYLVKLLVREYGLDCLQQASNIHKWIVPELLKKPEEEERILDPFVLHNDIGYHHLRTVVSNAAYGKQMLHLVESTKDLNIQETVPLLLAMYQKITLSHASIQRSKQILSEVLGDFNMFIGDSKVLPKEMQWMARSLIANQQGGPFPLLSVAPRQSAQCRTLTALVVHATAVFFSRQNVELLWPFLSILTDPGRIANAYLPTMEEDHLQEAKQALGGRFYACPRGHPYFVGECGRPVEELTCHTCGASIGGMNHLLRSDNATARNHDNTQTGHVLGNPTDCSTVPAPERNLSPPAICVMRALMHSAFLWACCNNDQSIGDIVQVVKPRVPVNALPEFFWQHLINDINLLRRTVGKGYEEAATVVHLVLKEILMKDPPKNAALVGIVKSLDDKNAREQWETIFNKHYIQPILGSLEEKVNNAMQMILDDDDQEQDQLFFLVYERMELMNHSSIQPHLWTYRSRITLEHLAQTLQEKRMKERHPILYEFLQAEPVLRATQYLPDIVRLQQCLYDAFHHRLDKMDAMTRTVGDFLEKITNENVRTEYQRQIISLQKAWSLVGHMLENHARLKIMEKHLIKAITNDTPLVYLIPTTTDAGACTTALVDFLVLAHNNFIDKCRTIVFQSEMSAAFWRKHEVPITHIHRCHLVDYEQQLLSIVLSHCNYSLTFGKGQSIKYDHQALEKHILDRFIHGKPRILSDIPHVVYRKDIYTTVTFAGVRNKVKKQEALPPHVKQEILVELCTPDRLREALDVVEIVLGFLSSGGGKADKPLGEYIDRMLKMKRRPFSAKAREYCCLCHILSLWEIVSVELAKQLYLRGQEPFDSVRAEFSKPLDRQKTTLEECLRQFDLDSLLGTLYEFIETHVKHSPDEELNWPIVDTLVEFLDRNDLQQIENFEKEFPGDITLSQTVATWKCIVDYQEKVRQESY